jgi:RNA:NAD 2'-phosphotransferase (TPT1/KptA family)
MAIINYGLRPVTTSKVAMSGTSAQSSAIGANIQYVRLVADANCHYNIGVNPTATTSTVYLPANEIETIKISEGEKVAGICASGNLYVTSLTE